VRAPVREHRGVALGGQAIGQSLMVASGASRGARGGASIAGALASTAGAVASVRAEGASAAVSGGATLVAFFPEHDSTRHTSTTRRTTP
jgi:hypothetical protein